MGELGLLMLIRKELVVVVNVSQVFLQSLDL